MSCFPLPLISLIIFQVFFLLPLNLSNLTAYIDILKPYNPESKLVAQTYDGASTMSGHSSGVQARIREVIQRAIFVHCIEIIINRFAAFNGLFIELVINKLYNDIHLYLFFSWLT